MTNNRLSLLVLGGVHDGRVIPIQTPFLIGRAAECNLRPASLAVSARHCAIEDCHGVPVARDLGSTNGTFLNGDRLMDSCELRDGDELQVGPLAFRVLEVAIRPEEEPVVNPAEIPRDADDTIVHGELQESDETVVNDHRLTEDEAAQLLLAEDDETEKPSVNSETNEAVLRTLDAIEEPVVPQPTVSAAKDILRQLRRSRK